MSVQIIQGDAYEVMSRMDRGSIQCCVTSPPYWGLRDYGVDGQIGLEETPEEYVETVRMIFREVRRLLRDDGTLWLNMGDCYAGGEGGTRDAQRWPKQSRNDHRTTHSRKHAGLKHKNIVGIPWRVAFALQGDGWYLRSDIIWHKPNPMPESMKDRPTKSHEYIFLLTKAARYYYDADAIKEPSSSDSHARYARGRSNDHKWADGGLGNQTIAKSFEHMRKPGVTPKAAASGSGIKNNESFSAAVKDVVEDRNKRTVWTVPTYPYPGAHFATFPPNLIRPCILAGCPQGGTVLDPFAGSGTTGMVAEEAGRNSILIELNPEYCEMAKRRTAQMPLFCI